MHPRTARVGQGKSSDYDRIVTVNAKKILSEALSLPEPERRALVEALSDSFEEPVAELPELWRDEVASRISQLERGEVEPVEWSEVEARIQRILTR